MFVCLSFVVCSLVCSLVCGASHSFIRFDSTSFQYCSLSVAIPFALSLFLYSAISLPLYGCVCKCVRVAECVRVLCIGVGISGSRIALHIERTRFECDSQSFGFITNLSFVSEGRRCRFVVCFLSPRSSAILIITAPSLAPAPVSDKGTTEERFLTILVTSSFGCNRVYGGDGDVGPCESPTTVYLCACVLCE